MVEHSEIVPDGRSVGDNSDLLAMNESISKDISEKMNLKLSGEEKSLLAKRDTRNPEAFQLYLKGRYFWNKRTGEDLKRAIELNPSYATAHQWRGEIWSRWEDLTKLSKSMRRA